MAKKAAKKAPGPFLETVATLPEIARIEIVIAQSRGRNAADREIERLVAEADDAADLRIVTSDHELADSVRAAGATVVSSGAFRAELES